MNNPFNTIQNPYFAVRIAQAYTVAHGAHCVLSMLAMVNIMDREDYDYSHDLNTLCNANPHADFAAWLAHAEEFLSNDDPDFWLDAGIRNPNS